MLESTCSNSAFWFQLGWLVLKWSLPFYLCYLYVYKADRKRRADFLLIVLITYMTALYPPALQ